MPEFPRSTKLNVREGADQRIVEGVIGRRPVGKANYFSRAFRLRVEHRMSEEGLEEIGYFSCARIGKINANDAKSFRNRDLVPEVGDVNCYKRWGILALKQFRNSIVLNDGSLPQQVDKLDRPRIPSGNRCLDSAAHELFIEDDHAGVRSGKLSKKCRVARSTAS